MIVPPIRNCSCVTGKYQQSWRAGDAASSAILRPRVSVAKVNSMRLVQEPPEYERAIRRAGRRRAPWPSARIAQLGALPVLVNRQDQRGPPECVRHLLHSGRHRGRPSRKTNQPTSRTAGIANNPNQKRGQGYEQ